MNVPRWPRAAAVAVLIAHVSVAAELSAILRPDGNAVEIRAKHLPARPAWLEIVTPGLLRVGRRGRAG